MKPKQYGRTKRKTISRNRQKSDAICVQTLQLSSFTRRLDRANRMVHLGRIKIEEGRKLGELASVATAYSKTKTEYKPYRYNARADYQLAILLRTRSWYALPTAHLPARHRIIMTRMERELFWSVTFRISKLRFCRCAVNIERKKKICVSKVSELIRRGRLVQSPLARIQMLA